MDPKKKRSVKRRRKNRRERRRRSAARHDRLTAARERLATRLLEDGFAREPS